MNKEFLSRFACQYDFDLSHAYHFDHPLDHVPGSYLMDIIFKKSLEFYPQLLTPHKFKINFKNFAQLEIPTKFSFEFSDGALSVEIIQEGDVITHAKLSSFSQIMKAEPSPLDYSIVYGKPHARALNKHKSTNIAVSALSLELVATSLPLELELTSHLYVFELAKQYLYLYGREKGQIEKDSKMSVFGIETSIVRELVPGRGFLIQVREKSYSEYNNKQFSKSVVEISDNLGVCASTTIEGVIKS